MNYRHLTSAEVAQLERQLCTAPEWDRVLVSEKFTPDHVFSSRFTGDIRLGSFEGEFSLAGGMKKHAGLYHVTLHNVEVGDNCCIERVNNYIANYRIGPGTFIENVDIILCDGESSFGNGVEVSVLNETGGREVMIHDRLSAQQAYVMALYRHRPELIERMRRLVGDYVASVTSSIGTIGRGSTIVDTGYIKNVKIGDECKIEGACRLKNGSINSNPAAPVHIGVGVIGDDFIISSGASVEDGVTFSRCFIGQACRLGHNYSASDSLFFSNCQGENGEACAIFAGPFTVTHHKSSLLIAGMFSFMNAGSGSNQSNHMYKLGPIHQGIMERGAKTASDSYLLWPAKVGAFSLVMGRHVDHQDTSDLPFSYLIEDHGVSYVMPGANLKSVGTIRDAKKWPRRDGRKDPDKFDCINFNLLSPYTIQKMLRAVDILKELRRVSGSNSGTYSYQNGRIRSTSLDKGLNYYGMAIDKFLGNSLISRIQKAGDIKDADGLRAALRKDSEIGAGDWVDLSGLIAPRSEVFALLDDIESGAISDVRAIDARFHEMHANYYSYEWTWAHDVIESWYDVDLETVSTASLMKLVHRWKDAVVSIDNLVYEDARKEFSLSAMTSFGADGDEKQRNLDFFQVRGASFENDPFVKSVADHIVVKSQLARDVLALLDTL
ncbi:MAG: DUF4954 family protein [Bacteroidales bacterium]|nr:DUF4954 family protein [Bacteroidales bacterium]